MSPPFLVESLFLLKQAFLFLSGAAQSLRSCRRLFLKPYSFIWIGFFVLPNVHWTYSSYDASSVRCAQIYDFLFSNTVEKMSTHWKTRC